MKITDIDTVMYDSPGRKWTVVRVFTDAGIIGLGEATYSNKEPVVCSAVDNMKQELIGQDPARIEWIWHHIYRRPEDFPTNTRHGAHHFMGCVKYRSHGFYT